MKLYDAMTPNSLRVNVFLAEKGIDVPREKVDILAGGTRSPEFLAVNTLGGLPTIELEDGTVLTESVAICRYFEGLHPEPNMMGRTPLEQAQIEMWNRRVELELFNVIGGVARHSFEFFADKVEQIPAYADSQRRNFAEKLAWFDNEMSDGRSFIVADRLTVADITGMAVLFVTDLAGSPIPDHLRHAKRWEAAMRARPSFAGMRQAA